MRKKKTRSSKPKMGRSISQIKWGSRKKQPPMLDLLLQALSALHGGTNRLWPGVTVAWLADKQKFYASVCTYGGMNPAQKTVTHKATGDTALEALVALCRIWHDSTINPLVNFQRGLGIEKKGKVVPFRKQTPLGVDYFTVPFWGH